MLTMLPYTNRTVYVTYATKSATICHFLRFAADRAERVFSRWRIWLLVVNGTRYSNHSCEESRVIVVAGLQGMLRRNEGLPKNPLTQQQRIGSVNGTLSTLIARSPFRPAVRRARAQEQKQNNDIYRVTLTNKITTHASLARRTGKRSES